MVAERVHGGSEGLQAGSGGEPLLPLWGLLERACSRSPDAPLFGFEGLELSAAQLRERALGVAAGLASIGVGPGDNVAVMLRNGPELVTALFALARLGAVEVPVNTALVGAYLGHILRDSQSRWLVVDAEWVPRVADAVGPEDQAPLLVVEGASDRLPPRAVTWESVAGTAHGQEAADVALADPACILYTSGTTGASKGVVLSHGYFHRHALIKLRALEIASDDVLYTCLPLFHVNARTNTLVPALVTGARAHIAQRFSVSRFWEDVGATGATVFTLIGSMAQMLLNAPPSPRDRAHSVRLAFGGPIPPERVAEFEDRFRLVTACGYGLTEAMGVMHRAPGGPPAGCGRPIPEFEVRVVDEQQQPVPPGVVGELLVRPTVPHVFMSGYYGNPAATVRAWRDLWFHTGDGVWYDDAGEYYFFERKKDSLRRRGENISASELEAVISSHAAVADCAVIGVPSDLTEDDVKLVAVLAPGAAVTERQLVDDLAHSVPRYALPRYVEFVTELPKTPTLRVEKYRLKEAWASPTTWDSETGSRLGGQTPGA